LAAEPLLRRVNDLSHEVDLLKLGMAELHARLESVLALSKISLAQFEQIIRRQQDEREALALEYETRQERGEEDLVG
jgi:hypothetical protein